MSDHAVKNAKIAVRQRTMSEAAAKHLLSEKGRNARLSEEIGNEAERIRVAWAERSAKAHSAYIIRTNDPKGHVVEVKVKKFPRGLFGKSRLKAASVD